VQIRALQGVTELASNRSYSCAVVAPDRDIRCWGLPEVKQTDWDSALPRSDHALQTVVPLAGVKHVKQLELGERFGIAVTDRGEVFYWGASHADDVRDIGKPRLNNGRLKFASTLEPQYRDPLEQELVVQLAPLDLKVERVEINHEVRRVIVSGYYTCLVLADGGPWCEWTLNRTPFRIQELWPSVRFELGR
jgi:alpha-tubulin suppressor-like RCC1 family protein